MKYYRHHNFKVGDEVICTLEPYPNGTAKHKVVGLDTYKGNNYIKLQGLPQSHSFDESIFKLYSELDFVYQKSKILPEKPTADVWLFIYKVMYYEFKGEL